MKIFQLAQKLFLGAIGYFPIVVTPQLSWAQQITFFCGLSDAVPATLARTPQGEVLIVRWDASTLGEFSTTPQNLCKQVSQTLQTYYNRGELKYITTGKQGDQPMVCLAEKQGGACTEVLFSLNEQKKPGTALQETFRIRVPSTGPISETPTPIYIDIEKYLNGEYPSWR
jgi:hypothetical protein